MRGIVIIGAALIMLVGAASAVAARPSQETAIDVWGVVAPDATGSPGWGTPGIPVGGDNYFAAHFIGTGDDWCAAWLDARLRAIAAGWDADSLFLWGADSKITDTCTRTHDAIAPQVFKVDIYVR